MKKLLSGLVLGLFILLAGFASVTVPRDFLYNITSKERMSATTCEGIVAGITSVYGSTTPVTWLLSSTVTATACTVPANVTIACQGGMIDANQTANAVTHAGPINCGDEQLFTDFAADSIVLSSNTRLSAVRLKWWAACDGTTDDLVAIKSATASNKKVIVPAATCVSSSFLMPTSGAIFLSGAGQGVSTIKLAASATAPIFQSVAGTTPAFVGFEHLTLDGNASNQTTHATGALEVSANSVYLHDVELTNSNYALRLRRIIHQAWIGGNKFRDQALHTGVPGEDTAAILVSGPGNTTGEIWIVDNLFVQTSPSATAGNGVQGIVVGVGNAVAQPLHITGNTLRYMGQDVAGTSNFIAPIQCYSTCDGTEIRGNKIFNTYYGGIKVQRSSNVSIIDNLISGEATIGATLSACIEMSGRAPLVAMANMQVRGNICRSVPNLNGMSATFDSGTEMTDFIIENNQLIGTKSGIDVSYALGVISLRNNIIKNTTGSTTNDGGIRVRNLSASTPAFIKIQGNHIEGTTKESVYIGDGSLDVCYVEISGNTFNANTAATTVYYCTNVIIANNTWAGTPTTVVDVRNNTLVKLHDNISANTGITRTTNTTVIDYNNSWSASGILKTARATTIGTSLVAGDFALSAGWGTTASVGTITGTDQRWQATFTSAGTGQGANPTITLTYKDGTWGTAPVSLVVRNGGTGVGITGFTFSSTATALTITAVGTPIDTETYILTGSN